jgi:hypothetical protein
MYFIIITGHFPFNDSFNGNFPKTNCENFDKVFIIKLLFHLQKKKKREREGESYFHSQYSYCCTSTDDACWCSRHRFICCVVLLICVGILIHESLQFAELMSDTCYHARKSYTQLLETCYATSGMLQNWQITFFLYVSNICFPSFGSVILLVHHRYVVKIYVMFHVPLWQVIVHLQNNSQWTKE